MGGVKGGKQGDYCHPDWRRRRVDTYAK